MNFFSAVIFPATVTPHAKRQALAADAVHVHGQQQQQQPQQSHQQQHQPAIFSPIEQMEELDVVSAYCYGDEDVESLEKALGIDFQDPNMQRELLAK